MTIVGTKPHHIYLAGQWVESPDVLEVSNPADGGHPFLVARRVVPVPGEQVVVPTAEQARATLAAAGAPTPAASPPAG